jgi:hypothetical protein
VFIAVLVIGVLWLMVASRGFRKAATALIAVGVVGVLALVLWLRFDENERARNQDLARHRMTANEINLSDMAFDFRGGHLTGRLHNDSSRFAVSAIGLRLTLQDCDASGCDTVGEQNTDVYQATPPGQSRDFSEFVFFPGNPTPKRGVIHWNYQVLYVEANPPS